ncbi:hypothetical protein ABPG72_016347 [Tetrahymena utriculariae]
MARANKFDCSYLEVIIFENNLEKSYSLLYLTINLKFQVLNMMKQKHIIATELISKIENIQRQIKLLKNNLNYLIQLNDESLDLLNLQALLLENLSFSEKDINLVQINKFRRKQYNQQTKYVNNQNQDQVLSSIFNQNILNEKSCVIFASFNDSKNMIVNQISSNFSNLFCFSKKEHIKGLNIQSTIPLPFQNIHNIYLKQYFEESIISDIYENNAEYKQDYNKSINFTQNDCNYATHFDQSYNYKFSQSKYLTKMQTVLNCYQEEFENCKMNQKIIFASLNQMFILPIKVSIKTNEYQEKEIFGLVTKVKQINEEYQFILFKETDLSIIVLTEYLH